MKKLKSAVIIALAVFAISIFCSGCGANPDVIATDFVENLFNGKISKCVDAVHDNLIDDYGVTRKEFKKCLNGAYQDTMDLYDSFKLVKVEIEESYEDSYICFDDAWSTLVKYTFSYRDPNTRAKITDSDCMWIMIYDGKVVDF